MSDDRDVFTVLQGILSGMLGLSPAEITPGSTLIGDLGAESLDLLDFTFQIEETFGVKIDPNEFSRAAGDGASLPVLAEDGRTFTDEGLAMLRRMMPEVPAERFTPGLDRTGLPRLLTVEVFVNLVRRKLADKEADHA